MGHYIINFTVYTLAMSGLICFALFVYKKVMNGSFGPKASKFLEIEETMSVNPRKTLMVVRAGNEHFLIASDMDRTSLISKLDFGNRSTYSKAMSNDNNLDTIYPSEKQNEIHLEVIKNNNPKSPRLKRKKIAKSMTTDNMVTLNFDKPIDHGFPPMKEMAMKINEL